MVRLVLATVVGFGMTASALAFNVNGFYSGMSQEEAVRLFRSRFSEVSPIARPDGSTRGYVGSSAAGSIVAIQFCDGRLASYQYDVAGGIRSFVRLVQREQSVAGLGSAEAIADETPVGEWSMIQISWPQGRETKRIIFNLITGKEQVFIEFAVPSPGCSL